VDRKTFPTPAALLCEWQLASAYVAPGASNIFIFDNRWNDFLVLESLARKMQLIPVSLENLSAIKFTVALAPHERYRNPEFLVVAFAGTYRDGAEGAPDATFIAAIMEAVQRAWFTESLIVDLTQLEYYWGDEMDWIFDVGRFQPSPCNKPLAIIVSENCRDALKTLAPEEFDRHCVESFDEAVACIRAQKPAFDECMNAWRGNP
jgi:hypothetical protein